MKKGGFSTYKQEFASLLVLAVPLVIAQLAQSSVGFVDTLMAGRLGGFEIAAVGLGNSTFFPLYLTGMGFMFAISPLVSNARGAGEIDPIGRSVRQGMWLAVFLSIPLMVLLWKVEALYDWTGQDPEVAAMSAQYLKAISFGLPAALLTVALRSFLEGVERPRVIMLILFLGLLVNIVADYALMFGRWGLPRLGVVGTGIASSIVFWVMFLAAFLYVKNSAYTKDFRVFSKLGKPDYTYFKKILQLGSPIAVFFLIEVALFAATAMMMGNLGPTELASHQIGIQIAAFTFMIPVGLSLATAVRVGFNNGQGDAEAARISGNTGMMAAAGVMVICAIVFWTIPRQIVGLFIDLSEPQNATIIATAMGILWVAGFFQVFDGIQVSAGAALRGLKDTKIPMLLAFLTYWGVGFSVGIYTCYGLEWGPEGLWWGLVAGLAAAALALGLRFKYLTSEKTNVQT